VLLGQANAQGLVVENVSVVDTVLATVGCPALSDGEDALGTVSIPDPYNELEVPTLWAGAKAELTVDPKIPANDAELERAVAVGVVAFPRSNAARKPLQLAGECGMSTI